MSLLTYAKYAAPTSHKDVLSKIRTFAVAQGWVSDDYQTSKQWALTNGTYGWMPGTEDFLQLSSIGYGSQDMIFRFKWEGTGVDSEAELCYLTGIEPGQGTPNNTLSTHPVLQDDYTQARYSKCSLPPGATTALWVFGNDKFIIAINQINETFLMAFYFGTIELFDPSETECFMCTGSHYSGSGFYEWYEAEDVSQHFVSPWVQSLLANYPFWYYDGGSSGDVAYNVQHHESGSYHGEFNVLDNAVARNNFTGKRTLIKPTVYFKRDSDSLWFPAGTFPFYIIDYTGLTIGQTLTYGSEEYLCFPDWFSSRRYGTAFRVV